MPTAAEALDIGWKKHQSGDVRGAEQIYLQVTQVAPKNANAWCFLGMARHDLRRFEESVEAYRKAVRLQPNFPIAYSNMANSYKELGQFDEAIACCQKSLRLKPDYVTAYNNWGVALVARGDMEEAVAIFSKSVSLDARVPVSQANLGAALIRTRQYDEGEKHTREALRLDPNYAEAHKTLAIVTLLRGDLQRGFEEYEWRWKCPAQKFPNFPRPVWDGSPLNGRRLLLLYEQGLGDTIHFIRYAKILKAAGGRITVVCQRPLMSLLANCAGLEYLIAEGEPIPPFDCYLPLLSVPRVLRTTVTNLPAEIPYLTARPDLVEKWRAALSQYDGLKIGIAWQGSPSYHADRQRSIPLAAFEPLARVPGVRLFSLQKGLGIEQLAACREQFPVLDFGEALDRDVGPFMDTAAILKNLDLVITADTSLGHVAGALGVPTWLAMCTFPDWRWMFDREDSPWYPTIRIFRQQQLGDWEGVFARIAEELGKRVSGV